MADSITISSPIYSFVKFDKTDQLNANCEGDAGFCLPFVNEDDIKFQVKINAADYNIANAIMNEPIANFQLLLLKSVGNTPATVVRNTLRNFTSTYSLLFERYRSDVNEITLLWKNPLKGLLRSIGCDGCFELAVLFNIGGVNYTAVSNCFIRKCSDQYSSIIEYYNDDNYADFVYCNVFNAVNRIRLPLYLSQPKLTEDKSVYRKSNGTITQTYSLIGKDYLALVDVLPEYMHDKISIVMGHDYVNIWTGNYVGGISKSGDYTINWTDNVCKASANFKVTATPLAYRNSNCADCDDSNIPPACGTIKDILSLTVKNDEMEAGSVIMWSGSINAIPTGWALCDGTNGTPNLKGRFIVGYDPGDPDYNAIDGSKIGGEKKHTLTIGEMPPHDHGMPHQWNEGGGGHMASGGNSDEGTITDRTQSTGGGNAHENRPPYFVLAYIMKLSS